MKKPRWYQRRCTKKMMEAINEGPDVHPVGAIPTAAGKTFIVCLLTEAYLNENVEKEVLVLSHRQEILEQDIAALEEYFAVGFIGVYSAGLKEKEKRKITVAGIQSVWKKPELFHKVGLVIIDEAHLINPDEEGMYREFLGYLDANFAGLTATHFRMKHGYIHEGEDALFNRLAYDLTSVENYNKLVRQGYLSKMFPRPTKLKLSTDGVRTRGGDWRTDDLSKKHDREAITDVACNEILEVAREENLKKWLIFAIDIQHAEHIYEKLKELGVNAAIVHSKMSGSRKIIFDAFRKGIYTALVNVEIATTGLDIPDIDLVATLRSTRSPSLHVQILGRGARVVYAPGYDISIKSERLKAIRKGPKPRCIVMDFAGNVKRLGPINDVEVITKKKKPGGSGNPITKVCPDCNTIVSGATKYCDCCGHEFEFKEKIGIESGGDDIIKWTTEKDFTPHFIDEFSQIEKDRELYGDIKRQFERMINGEFQRPVEEGVWVDVDDVRYSIHSRPGKTSSLKVEYICGIRRYIEYICIDHGGWPRHLAKNWVKLRVPPGEKKPTSLSELYAVSKTLLKPKKIFIRQDGQWKKIIDYSL